MALYQKILLATLLTYGCALCAQVLPAPQATHTQISTEEFAAFAVLDGGRIKPLDTVARAALMRFGGRQSISKPSKKSAAQWLLELTTTPAKTASDAIFRLDHPQLKALVATAAGLPATDFDKKMFSYAELEKALGPLAQATAALPADAAKQDAYERQLSALIKNISTYHALAAAFDKDGLFAQVPPVLTAATQSRLALELNFNKLNPFLWSEVFYVLAFVALLVSTLRTSTRYRTAWGFLLLALAIHLGGVVARMIIQERPPVTNLYSSALFVGLIAVGGAALIERGLKNGLGLALAALAGFATLQIADKLAESGDTLEMMRAVLDSNFWLATHVVVVTLGYAAMFVAGGIATLAVLKALAKGVHAPDLSRTATAVYATTCVALLFSFVGTMLGGVWADQSWGRFWGWDPKENGALMIVLWAALILHARWGGLVRERGILALAMAGNIITAWSWFGTNMLGVGLHSYGFTNAAFWTLAGFVAFQLSLIIAGSFVRKAGAN